jgi:hypothetical protein
MERRLGVQFIVGFARFVRGSKAKGEAEGFGGAFAKATATRARRFDFL